MSAYDAISAVTASLREILRNSITNSTEPTISGVPIDLRSPKEIQAAANATGVSLWLYRVVRDGHTLNHPPQRSALGMQTGWPLPINLYYLVTPIMGAPQDEQLLLGRALQAFNDVPTLRGPLLQGSLSGGAEELRLTLEPLTLEQLTRVWDALKEPYQLSASYQVQVLAIDSDNEPAEGSRVIVAENDYSQVTGVR